MHRNPLLRLLENYQVYGPEDEKIVQEITRFVVSEVDCFERTLAIGHVTGSAWVIDPSKSKALLTHHRKLNKWLQLGGHADGDPDIFSVALREVQEESGLQKITPLSEEIFDIDIHLIPGPSGGHYHYDVRFLFEADPEEKLIVSHESHDLDWVLFDTLEKISQEPSVLRMRKKTELFTKAL